MRRLAHEAVARDVVTGIEAVEVAPHLRQFLFPVCGQRLGRLVGDAPQFLRVDLPVKVRGLRERLRARALLPSGALGTRQFEAMLAQASLCAAEQGKFWSLHDRLYANQGKLTNTGVLFFSKNPKKYLINAYVTCARYKGTEKVKVIDRKDIEANLIRQVEDSIKFIERNTMVEYEIKGLERKEIPEYPIEALREAVLNAVMHRDYFERGANVQIDIFDDRITVTNIGGLLKPLTKEKLGKIAIRRNPLIADLFHRVRLVEKMGTGILRIINECRKHGKVSFEVETNGFFISKFLLKTSSKKTVEKTVEKILSLIKKNPKITQDELVKNTGLTRRGIEWNLAQLKERGILKRVGPDKGGHWEVNNV